jgi:hypothetical protein
MAKRILAGMSFLGLLLIMMPVAGAQSTQSPDPSTAQPQNEEAPSLLACVPHLGKCKHKEDCCVDKYCDGNYFEPTPYCHS